MRDALPETDAIRQLKAREPMLWINPHWQPASRCIATLPIGRRDLEEAAARLHRFAPLLQQLFAELEHSQGIIESALMPIPSFTAALSASSGRDVGTILLKADHALPVAGSIKARGGIYAVLHFAERKAIEHGLLAGADSDYRRLLSPEARRVFSGYELTVGSTGNLGLSIGIMGAALGFSVTVHMSREAKEWKKARLRARGVRVVEHASDYTAACVVARDEARRNPRLHFIDDENSLELFLGYSVAALRLRDQLKLIGRPIDEEHPLFLHLPCGVGGAPGGITFGARLVFGDLVHCFFAEPVEAPCMTLGMASGRHAAVSVYDIGLSLRTDADGLAVSRPSQFVGRLMEPLLSGCYTVRDSEMFRHLLALHETEAIEIEPPSAAAAAGPLMVLGNEAGRRYLDAHGLLPFASQATHILWTTGGALVPAEQHAEFRRSARSG